MADRKRKTVFAMFVRPGFEGRGLGRALMHKAQAWFVQHGVARPWLTTGADPEIRAHGFYRRLGWQADGMTEDGQMRYVKDLLEPDAAVPS